MLEQLKNKLAAGEPATVVAYGDSISEFGRAPSWHGGAKAPGNWWGNQLQRMLAEAVGDKKTIRVQSFGVGGHNSYEGLGRLDWLAAEADLVLLAFGANDCGWHEIPPGSTATAFERLIDCLRFMKKEVVVVGFVGDNPAASSMAHVTETAEAIRQVAVKLNVPWIDLRAAVLEATDHGRRWSEFHNGPQDCHPNDAGHALWAKTVMEFLRPHL